MLFRKFTVILSGLLCLALTVAANGSMSTSWHGLSQSQRNAHIVSTAMEQVGDRVGMQCKEWVQNVVYEASQGAVYPPQNMTDFMWAPSSNVTWFPQPFPVSWTQPGDIIQMRWRNQSNGATYPHTAIVVGQAGSGMYWADCNWSGNGQVQVHYVSTSQFNACVGYNYNIYEIR